MKIKKILLFIMISIFCFVPVVSAKEDVVVKSIKVVDSSDEALNSVKKINVEFNDLDQFVQYKIVLKNNTKKDLYTNSLNVEGSSKNFVKYTLDDKSRSKIIKANGEEEILITIQTFNTKGAGRNLSDNISFKLLLNDKIENPNTSSNLITTIILVIISAVAITFVMTKFNNKKGTIATVIVCFMLLGTSFVFADDTVVVNFKGKVKYNSQNYLETTGTTILNHKANYTSSKDIWTYSNQVKNINISSENNNIETYAHTFDLTINDKQRVKAYLIENGDQNIPYDLYIISNGVIYAPEDSTGLFSFPNVETINGLENVIFDNTTKMTGMFIGNEKLNTVDLSTVDTTNVKDTSYMFHKCFNLNVDESKFDLENVEVRNNMFVQYLSDVLKDNAQSDAKIDFSKISSSTNGEGVYLRSGTEKDKNPIYYYRGNVTNNNVKFAGFCWKMVRTTETGGIKLIYNGTPASNGYCNNTGTASQIGTSAFNTNNDSPAYVGYMYGTAYSRLTKSSSEITSGIVYGNDIEYREGKYYLKDTYTSENGWRTDYTTIGEKYHYTCFSTSDSCEMVNYIFYAGDPATVFYIPLTGGKNQLNLLDEMLTKSTNEKSSTIKNYIDEWYKNNMVNYTNYLEDTVWCNDRSINQLNGWDKDKNATSYLYFGAYGRLVGGSKPSIECSNPKDKFTVSNSNGNGKLTYPVALLTADELVLAGAKWNTAHSNFYLYTGQHWWALSPYTFSVNRAYEFRLASAGILSTDGVNSSLGVRPSVSLKSGIDYTSGSGTTTNPYVIE